jgi:hypothetical protein
MYGSRLPAQNCVTDVVDAHGLDHLQRFACLNIQRQPAVLVALAHDVGHPERA